MTRTELQQRNKPKPIATQGAEFRNFGEQLQAIARAENNPSLVDPRLTAIQQRAALGNNEAVPSDGGFIVGPDYFAEIISKAYQTGQFLGRTTEIPISASKNSVIVPGFDEQSRANGSRFGGVQVNWLEEEVSIPASKPKFRRLELTPRKLIGLCYVTDELLEDADSLGAVLTQAFACELALVVERACVVTGTGAGMPLGILNSNAVITVNKEVGQAPVTVVAQNIQKLWARMWAPCRSSAVWFVHQDVENLLPALSITVGTGGSEVPLYRSSTDPSQPFATMLGSIVVPTEWSAALGSVGDVVYAAPSEYLIASKGLQVAYSMHVRFIEGEGAFRFSLRIDGAPAWHTPLTPLNGSNTLSPFITLAAR